MSGLTLASPVGRPSSRRRGGRRPHRKRNRVRDIAIAGLAAAVKERGDDKPQAAIFAYASTAYPRLAGTLVTIAEAAPPNLFHFVCENGTYEANGGHPIPGRGTVDFAGFARSAGWRSVHEFSDLKIFEQQAGALLAERGPVFVDLKVVPSGPQERDYSRIHGPHVRKAFREALGGS